MRILKQLVLSLALLLSVTVVLFGCDGDKGTGGGGGGNNTGGNNTGYTGIVNKCGADGTANSCKTVVIAGQKWMAENLNKETGDSWCLFNSTDSCAKYGRLYTWEAAKTACQSVGWKLPDTADWNRLLRAAGGHDSVFFLRDISWYGAATKLKATSGWKYNDNVTDELHFSALPGGRRQAGQGFFGGRGELGYWWTATGEKDINIQYTYHVSMSGFDAAYNDVVDFMWTNGALNGNSSYSVRCVEE